MTRKGSIIRTSALSDAEQAGNKMMQYLGVSSLEEMRALPAEKVLTALKRMLSPVVDGYLIPESLIDIYEKGKQNPVSLLTGWNKDEHYVMGQPKNATDFKADIERQFRKKGASVIKAYSANNDTEAVISQYRFSRDFTFGVHDFIWAKVNSNQGSNTYVYRFNKVMPGSESYGAFHTGEFVYAYDNLKILKKDWQERDYNLAAEMSAYWVNFVKTGNPNGKNLPKWNSFSDKNPKSWSLTISPNQNQCPTRWR